MSQESQSWKSSFKITKTNGRGSGEISKNESERKCHRLPSQVTKQPSVEITESLSELPRGVVDPQSPAATWSSAGFCFPDEFMNTLPRDTSKVSGVALVAGRCEVRSICTPGGGTGRTCSSAGCWA